MRVESAVSDAPSVSHVKVRVRPSSVFRHRHRKPFTHDADDRFKDGFEVPSSVRGERAGDVLPYDVSWVFAIGGSPHFFDDSDGLIEQNGLVAIQPRPFSRDRHIRTGRAERDDIHRLDLASVHGRYVAVMFHEGQPLCGHPNWERLDLRSPQRGDPRKQTAQGEAAAPVKEGAEGECISFVHATSSETRNALQTERLTKRLHFSITISRIHFGAGEISL